MSPADIPVIAPMSSRGRPLSAELLDRVTDAVVSAPDRVSRGDAIAALVGEMYESVAWLHADPDSLELASLRRVIDAAAAHRDLLASLDDLVGTTSPVLALTGDASLLARAAGSLDAGRS